MALDRRMCLQGFGIVAALGAGLDRVLAEDAALPRVKLVVPSLELPVFAACGDGGKEAAKDLGTVAFSTDAPPKPSAEEQIKLVTALIAQKVAALAIRAVDGPALAPVCRKATQRGIPVIAFEAPLPRDARLLQIKAADIPAVGRLCMQMAARTLHGKGRIAVLFPDIEGAPLVAALKREWVRPEYDRLKLVAVRAPSDSAMEALRAADTLVKEHPDIDAVVALSPAGLLAAAIAVSALGSAARIRVTGLGLPSQMHDFVKSGVAEQFAYWNPIDLGYCATTLAGLAATGKLTAAANTNVAVGRLGALPIAADLTITMAAPTLFDRSNIDQFSKTF